MIRAMRVSRGLGLADAARRAGISHSHLSNVEAGRRGLSAPAALRLAELLGTTVPALIAG